MKIRIEYQGRVAICQDTDVNDICDAMDLVEQSLIDVGYSRDRVEAAIIYRAKALEKER